MDTTERTDLTRQVKGYSHRGVGLPVDFRVEMPSRKPMSCRICGGHESEVGRVSWNGRCGPCGDARQLENHRDLRDHAGPWFAHWRQRSAASFGAVLLDDLDDTDTSV